MKVGNWSGFLCLSIQNLERKLKRERVKVCLNCKKFLNCDCIGRYEECVNFDEVEDGAWVVKRI